MKGSWGLWIGVTLVALNMLVFGQDLIAWRTAAPGPAAAFPLWPAVTLGFAVVYLLVAGIMFDRKRRTGR